MVKIFEYLHEREKKINKESELIKNKLNSLNLVERNAYDSIIERNYSGSLTLDLLKGVPYAVVDLGILALVLKFFLQIDIIEPLKNVAIILLELWLPLILIGVVIDMIEERKLRRLRKRLLKI